MRSKRKNHYVLCWDDLGLHHVYDVNEDNADREAWTKKNLFSILKDGSGLTPWTSSIPIKQLIITASRNKHIHPEVIEIETNYTVRDLMYAFEKQPTEIKNELRNSGIIIYSLKD